LAFISPRTFSCVAWIYVLTTAPEGKVHKMFEKAQWLGFETKFMSSTIELNSSTTVSATISVSNMEGGEFKASQLGTKQ
jgi:hypothetical protein